MRRAAPAGSTRAGLAAVATQVLLAGGALVPWPGEARSADVSYAGIAGARLEDAGTLVVRGGGPFDRSESFEVLRRPDGGYTLLNTITAANGAYRVQARFDHDAQWRSQRAHGLGLYQGRPVRLEMRREGPRVVIRVEPATAPPERVADCDPDCFINMSPSATAMFVMTRHYDFARGGEQEFRWAGQDLDRERTLSGGLAKLRFVGELSLPRATGAPLDLRHFTFVESLPLPDGRRFLLDFDLWTDREHRPMAFRIRSTGGSPSGVLGVREDVEGLRAALAAAQSPAGAAIPPRPLTDFPVWAAMDGLWKGDLDYLDAEGEFITRDYDALFDIRVEGTRYVQRNWMFYPPGPSAAAQSRGLARPGEGVEVVLNTYGSAIDQAGTMRVDLIDHLFDFEGGEITRVVNDHVAVYEYVNPRNGVRQHTQMVHMPDRDTRLRSAQGVDPNEFLMDFATGRARLDAAGKPLANPRFGRPRAFSLFRERRIDRARLEEELANLRLRHNVRVRVTAGPTPKDPSVIRRTDVPVTECDLLANHPFDAHRVSAGVAQEKVDTARAIPACLRDQKSDPDNGRLTYQAGRVLFYAGRVRDAYPFLERAAYELDYPQGQFVLGFLHEQGQGVRRDLCKAAVLWRRAALADHFYAQYSFGKAVLDGRFDDCGVRRTPEETLRFLESARAKAAFTGLEGELDALIVRARAALPATPVATQSGS